MDTAAESRNTIFIIDSEYFLISCPPSLYYYFTCDQSVTSPVKICLICSLVRSSTLFSLFTTTAIPSIAIVVPSMPSAVSSGFRSLEDIPMSHAPSIVLVMPAAVGGYLLKNSAILWQKIAAQLLLALAGLIMLKLVGDYLGVKIAVNIASLLLIAFLGLPGAGLVVVLNFILG